MERRAFLADSIDEHFWWGFYFGAGSGIALIVTLVAFILLV